MFIFKTRSFINIVYFSLPLPKDIANWKGIQYVEENIDVPDNHDGRIRSFQHERGNWATLVYIDCKSTTFFV